jgi:N-acetylneuraminic acid mutarotase
MRAIGIFVLAVSCTGTVGTVGGDHGSDAGPGGGDGSVQTDAAQPPYILKDEWLPFPVTTGTPSARFGHSAVWTGTKMIIWGGASGALGYLSNYLNDGAAYNPATDSWAPISMQGAPSARFGHSAVWTGTKMIVWGGGDATSSYNDGAAYDPATDSWAPISAQGAPDPRWAHSTAWTGTKMIVWGGSVGGGYDNLGSIYDPATDSWAPLVQVNPPGPRLGQSGIWAGSKMVIFGGLYGGPVVNYDTGYAYDPATTTWSPISTTGAPSGRFIESEAWTGTKMIVWGGLSGSIFFGGTNLADGSVYDPSVDSWTVMSADGAPSGRAMHTAVWTGTEMIVWGGGYPSPSNSGGIYH